MVLYESVFVPGADPETRICSIIYPGSGGDTSKTEKALEGKNGR